MLTLTLPPLHRYVRQPYGPGRDPLSAHALTQQLETVRELWRRTTARVRWARYHAKRGNHDDVARNCPPPERHGDVHPEYSTTWTGTQWEDAGTFALIWALETTTGKRGTHWHPHIHILTPTRGWAERVNAAWQASCTELGILPLGQWARTDITEACGEQLARYIAKGGSHPHNADRAIGKYVTKGSQLDKLTPRALGAYVQVMHNRRRWDALGAWRPLGLKFEAEDPVTHVLAPTVWGSDDPEHEVPAADWYSGKSICYRMASTRATCSVTDTAWDSPNPESWNPVAHKPGDPHVHPPPEFFQASAA